MTTTCWVDQRRTRNWQRGQRIPLLQRKNKWRLQFFCIFHYILFVGFQCVLSCIFLLHVSFHFHLFPLWVFAPFPLVSCIFKHFWIYFSKSFTRLLHFPLVFAQFPLVVICCYHIFLHFHYIFPAFSNGFCTISSDRYHVFLQFLHPLRGLSVYLFISHVVVQEFYPSPSFPAGFCTISSGCYHMFLHFHYIFPAFLLHRHGLFLAFAPVSSIFQRILHGLFLAFAQETHKGRPRGNRYPTVSKLPSGAQPGKMLRFLAPNTAARRDFIPFRPTTPPILTSFANSN